jgi:hypothetical protein
MDASMTQEGVDSLAVQGMDELLMVMLERLVRVYGRKAVAEILHPLAPVDRRLVTQLIAEVLALEHGSALQRVGGGPFSMR